MRWPEAAANRDEDRVTVAAQTDDETAVVATVPRDATERDVRELFEVAAAEIAIEQPVDDEQDRLVADGGVELPDGERLPDPPDPPACASCGAELNETGRDRVGAHATGAAYYRCPECGAGGEIVRDDDGVVNARRGPACDPLYAKPTARLAAIDKQDSLVGDGGEDLTERGALERDVEQIWLSSTGETREIAGLALWPLRDPTDVAIDRELVGTCLGTILEIEPNPLLRARARRALVTLEDNPGLPGPLPPGRDPGDPREVAL